MTGRRVFVIGYALGLASLFPLFRVVWSGLPAAPMTAEQWRAFAVLGIAGIAVQLCGVLAMVVSEVRR